MSSLSFARYSPRYFYHSLLPLCTKKKNKNKENKTKQTRIQNRNCEHKNANENEIKRK